VEFDGFDAEAVVTRPSMIFARSRTRRASICPLRTLPTARSRTLDSAYMMGKCALNSSFAMKNLPRAKFGN
jgi:hypothetical protein